MIFIIAMQNFAEIRSAILEKMTFEVAIFGIFSGYSRTEIVTSDVEYGQPDVTLLSCKSCKYTVHVHFISVKPEARSCPTLGLACVLMSRPISPELVLSPDFSFALNKTCSSVLRTHSQIIMKDILTIHCHLLSS